MALEDRIKEAREKANLTQAEAAALIGIAKSTWAGYETGNSQPNPEKIVRIMDVLGVDANYLWQDYIVEEKSPAPVDAEEEARMNRFALMLTEALAEAGFVDRGEDVSHADMRFIRGVAALIATYFDDLQ